MPKQEDEYQSYSRKINSLRNKYERSYEENFLIDDESEGILKE